MAAPLDHVNLLRYHKHNYRRGKGIVGDWKNSLVNEHLDVFREYGFESYCQALGYPRLPTLRPRDYSPYQRWSRATSAAAKSTATSATRICSASPSTRPTSTPAASPSSHCPRNWTRRCRTHDPVARTTSSRPSPTRPRTAARRSTTCSPRCWPPASSRAATRWTACVRPSAEWVALMGEIPDGRGLALCHRLQESLDCEGARP